MSPSRFSLALGLVLALAASIAADTCPGCGGTGRIGCGGCNAFPGVGICQKCTGNGSSYDSLEKRQKTCDRCHGTGKCAGCGGQGARCMVCQGSGQTQGGGGNSGGGQPGVALSEEQRKAKVLEALKPLGTLLGEWSGSGKFDGKSFQSQGRVVSCIDDTFFYIEWATQWEDGKTESSIDMLTYDPVARVYTMSVFSVPGQVMRTTGTGTEDGNGIVWSIVGNQNARFTWHLDNSDTWTTVVELAEGSGWKQVSNETQRRSAGGGDEGGDD